jgi:hypothetical protein
VNNDETRAPDTPGDNDDDRTASGTESLWASAPQRSAGDQNGPDDRASVAPDSTSAPSVGVPTRICPNCSAAEQVAGQFCPHCGASYVRNPGRLHRISRRAKLVTVSTLLLVLLGGGASAMALQHRNDAQASKREHARQAKVDAQRAARQLAETVRRAAAESAAREQEAQDRLTRSARRSLVEDLRKAITKDARERVTQSVLDGPIYGTQCDPVGGGNVSNLDATTGRYDCLAYNVKHDDGTIEGYRFSATINYDKFSYTWHLGS